MTHTGTAPHSAWGTSWWQSVLLGIVFMIAGLFVLRNAVLATVVSAIVFGIALLVAGLFEIVQAFWAEHWSGLFWRLLVGALYAVGGAVLVADPLAASVLLTLVFSVALIASGVMRIYLALAYWHRYGWLLLASGIVGVLAGLVVLLKWPLSGLWVFGLVVGIDLVLHGAWWVVSGLAARRGIPPA
ncbi:MAG: HdeD family acid-resistance protein [Hyphomicrobiaceae bacterium]